MELPVEPGSVIADKYRVVREIGRGGMGVVLAADHLQLPQQVAIKLLLAGASQTDAERFAREARIVVQIQSEHVCRVLDVGSLEGGEPYVVMELLEGQDLAQLVAAEGALSIADAVDYLLQACEAIAEAHLLGVVHRDLKPNNLFLLRRRDGSSLIKVLDFGIAKSQPRAAGGGLTQTGSVLGSPRFMSPEQLKSSRDVDVRSDIWSLGAVIYELLTGQAAFAAETMAELCVVILQDEPPPLQTVLPDTPSGLVEVVGRCLQKEPADRYANVAELALALAPLASDQARGCIERITKLFEASGWTAPAEGPGASAEPPPTPEAVADAPSAAQGTISMPQVDEPAVAPPAQTASAAAVAQPAIHPAPTAAGPVGPAPGAMAPPQTPLPLAAPAPFVQAVTSTPSLAPQRSNAALWIGLAIGGVVSLVAIVAVVGILVWRADDSTGPPKHSAREPSDSLPTVGDSDDAHDSSSVDMYALAPKLVADAIKRHGASSPIYEVTIYRNGYAKVELQHRTKPTSVVRYHYRGGGTFDKQDRAPLSDSERKEVAKAGFPRSAADLDAFARIRDDALKRAAKLEQPIVFSIYVRRGNWRTGPPEFRAFVESADEKLDLSYDARGRFVKKR